MRVHLFLSSRSPESKRLEAFLASRPGLGIPITRIETKEDADKARRGPYPITTVPTLLTIDAPTPGEGQIAQMWVGYDKIMDFFASTAPARPPRDRNSQDVDEGSGGRRPQPRPRARVMDEPEEVDPGDEDDLEPYEPEEEEPPPRAPKRKSKVGTPAQRRLAAKRLNRIARDEEPEERPTGREEAARKAAAAKRPRKQRTKMDDTLELAKRQQEAARKTVPGKDFLA